MTSRNELPVPPPTDNPRPTRATRHLSAGTWGDREYRERVLRDVYHDGTRAIAPYMGADTATVLAHARRAQSHAVAEAALLLFVVLAGLCVARTGAPAALAAMGALVVVAMLFGGSRHAAIARIAEDGAIVPGADPRLRRAAEEQSRPLEIYSGFDPFKDSGELTGQWQFALKLDPPPTSPAAAPAGTPGTGWPDFGVGDLVRHVRATMASLAHGVGRFAPVPGLIVTDHLMVAGVDAHSATRYTPDPVLVERVMCHPVEQLRHYLKFQVAAWDGEVVTTVYLHTALQGQTLYLEFQTRVMPPTRADFHVFDDPAYSGPAAVITGALRGLGRLPVRVWRSPEVLYRALAGASRPRRRRVRRGVTDFGALTSVRALGAESDFRSYFQWRDSRKYTAILEKRLFVALYTFLDGKVDMAELRARAETIINNGVINNGPGTANVGAAGPGSSATIGAVGTVHGGASATG